MHIWLFISCTSAVLIAGILIQECLSQGDRLLGRIVRGLASPDRALAFFALFFGFMVVLQQATNYHHGVVYQLSTQDLRDTIDGRHVSVIYGGMVQVVIGAYWFFFACALFAVASLIRGTIHEGKDRDELIASMRELIEEMKKERKGKNDKTTSGGT